MERTDVKNNHTEEYSTGQIRCIEKSDPEYPQIMKQYSSMPAKTLCKRTDFLILREERWQ